RLAVPAAVRELLGQQPVDQPIAGLAEVATERQRAAVDAGLDLALEERRVAEFRAPGDPIADEPHGSPRTLAGRAAAQAAQEQQRVQVGTPARSSDAIAPGPVRPLLAEKPRAPPFRGDPRSLRGDGRARLTCEVPHDLPANPGIRIEQPLHDR